jgi:hypothetical protein
VSPRERWLIFAVFAASASLTILWLGRNLTFFFDECDFLHRGDTLSLASLLAPHNEHWVTLPYVAYSGVRAAFGTGSYLPYLALLVVVHVATAAGLMRLIRPPALALALTCFFFFLGSGYENQFWAFQITFVGATGFGVWALVVARERPALGAVLLTAGVATALIALAFIPAAAVLMRRRAAWLLVPIAAFVPWYLAFGHSAVEQEGDAVTVESLARVPAYVLTGIQYVAARMSGLGPDLAGLLLIAAAASVALLIARGWRPPALAVAGAAGLVALFALIGLGRADTLSPAPRYVTTAAPFVFMLLTPLAALGRVKVAALVGVLLLSGAMASNATLMRDGAAQFEQHATGELRCDP